MSTGKRGRDGYDDIKLNKKKKQSGTHTVLRFKIAVKHTLAVAELDARDQLILGKTGLSANPHTIFVDLRGTT